MEPKSIFILSLFCNFFFTGIYCFAQVTFQKTYGGMNGENALMIKQTNDEGYIIAGSTTSFGAGASDIDLIKTDSLGNILWTKIFGGSNLDQAYSIHLTTDGGYIVVGNTRSFGAGFTDIFALKVDGTGNLQWSKTFGMTGGEEGNLALQTTDSRYIIFGNIYTPNSYNQHGLFLGKLDNNGNLIWDKMIGHQALNNRWSTNHSALITSDGGYLLVGETNHFNITYDLNIYVIKTDINGSLLWAKIYGGVNDDVPSCVEHTLDNGYIISGRTSSFGSGNEDIYLLKLDTSGSVLWSKTYGDTLAQASSSVAQTADGGYILTGSTGAAFADAFLLKTDSAGNLLWTHTYGGGSSDVCNSVQQTNDGGYILGGSTQSFGLGSADIYLIKTDSLGISNCHEAVGTFIVSTPLTTAATVAFMDSPYVAPLTPAFISSSGGSAFLLCLITGEEEVELPIQENDIAVYPNPASNEIFVISTLPSDQGALSIINMVGKEVYKSQISNFKSQINISNFPPGIYFVTLTDKNKSRVMKKFVKM